MSNKFERKIRREERKMSAEEPTKAEIAAMLNGLTQEPPEMPTRRRTALEVACGGSLELVQTPAAIVLRDEGDHGGVFYANGLQAWGWTPFGVLAVGGWSPDVGEDELQTKLFHGDVIHNIEFDKARYEELIAEIRAENEGAEDSLEVVEADVVE